MKNTTEYRNTKQSTLLSKSREYIQSFVIVCNAEGPLHEGEFIWISSLSKHATKVTDFAVG